MYLLEQEEVEFSEFYYRNEQLDAWPIFCHHHLSTDPEGCSSWCIVGEGEQKKYQLERQGDSHLFVDAYIAPERIDQAKAYLEYIPDCPTENAIMQNV